jgi:hypothetical protein
MRAFLRRFLMHYGIYRRYPLGLLPALRNAWRTARTRAPAESMGQSNRPLCAACRRAPAARPVIVSRSMLSRQPAFGRGLSHAGLVCRRDFRSGCRPLTRRTRTDGFIEDGSTISRL